MIFRKATINDAPEIAECLLLAMDSIVFVFIGKEDPKAALTFMRHFTAQENNQYSYQNCFVATIDTVVVAAINIYNGGALPELRLPIIKYLKDTYDSQITIEDETQDGECYIDTFGVKQNQQGKGIGSALLSFIIDRFVTTQKQTLGLLVEKENFAAMKLYKSLGFTYVSDKILVGKNLSHFQIQPTF